MVIDRIFCKRQLLTLPYLTADMKRHHLNRTLQNACPYPEPWK